ncbi:uncharacterized protein EI97DRAFT_191906 [Westerdykella ornata]|uniref:Uncharacterized protein n=1 Tax=Westerdykella ornata TaxID=318751 RepID=A0A6A6J9Z3_WESOR|nr:uncharacterized protein EI97DRAFT_191906 [Westerdykella ornata]KAF2272993.1 hypothetical protein EI97DRAFT_191906 [Westerdykella ornata]
MADIEKSFIYLQDTIPSWFKEIASIEEKIIRMQEEISRMPAQHSRPIKKKTGSMESIRDLDPIKESPNKPTAVPAAQLSTWKRKPASLASGTSSPTRYRSRAMMIIVHYDGQIQKQFETLVRSIGTGRNLLRKAKMAARAQALAALASSDDDDDGSDEDLMAKIQLRRRNGLPSMRTQSAISNGRAATSTSTTTPESLFDSTDKLLEQAQSLCERGAHQSLREGDCRKELAGMRKSFLEVQETAAKEVAKYNAQKEQEAAPTANPEPETELASSLPVPDRVLQPKLAYQDTKPLVPAVCSVPTAHILPKDTVLEVDDDDEDEKDFVMPPIRMMSRV